MKYTLFLTLIFASGTMAAQTHLPQQHQFDWNGTPTYLSPDSAYFKQDKFLFGWQWGVPSLLL